MASASGNLTMQISTSDYKKEKIRVLTSQVMTPASVVDVQLMSNEKNVVESRHSLQPLFIAVETQPANVMGDMYPLPASPWLAGFPMTILLRSTPFALISKTEEPGYAPPELVSRPVHVEYMELPSDQNWIRYLHPLHIW